MTQSTEQEIAAAWNAQADELNQWDVLDLQEQIEWAAKFGKNQSARRAQVAPMPNDVAALVAAAQALVLDPTSHVKKLQLEAHAWGPLAAAPQQPDADIGNPISNGNQQVAEAAPVQLPEPAAFALEWTFNGEERGMRLYDDETHCRFDAESDGGVCSPLYTERQVRQLLAAAPQPPETQPKSCIPEIQPIGCKEAAPTTHNQPR